MAWTAVNNGDTALASHVQQVIDALNGSTTAPQAILLTGITDANEYALTVRNRHAYGKSLLIEDKDGTDIARWNQFGLYSTKVLTVGNNGNIATSDDPYHLIYAHYNYTGNYTAGVLGQSMIDAISAEVTINPGNAYDFGAVQGVARNQSGVGAASMRGVAGQIIRYSGTTAADVEAGEFGVHNGASINSYADVGGGYQAYFGACGLLINSISGNIDGNVANGTGVRNNSAILIYGGAGWKQGICYFDTNQTTKLFEVDQNGRLLTRNRVLAGGSVGNSPGSPTYGFEDDANTGMYASAADTLAWSTGGVARMTLSDSTLTVNHALSVAQNEVRTGVISPAQITSNTDNYAPTGLATARILRLSTDASRNLTGITAQAAGTIITICNVGSFDLVLIHAATSSAANQFLLPGSVNLTVASNDSRKFFYDGTSAKWRLMA